MPYNIDPNQMKQQINSMFGPNAYENRMSQIDNVAKLNAQLDVAKKNYSLRLKAHNDFIKQQQAAAKKEQAQANKKNYIDAVNTLAGHISSVNDASKIANDIRNDPTKQKAIKDQGYTVTDYINALYNASSNGKYRSEREYNQAQAQIKKQQSDPLAGLKVPTNQQSKQSGGFGGLLSNLGHDLQSAYDHVIVKPAHAAEGAVNNFLSQEKAHIDQAKKTGKSKGGISVNLGEILNAGKQGWNGNVSGADVLNTAGIKNKTAQRIGGGVLDFTINPLNMAPYAAAESLMTRLGLGAGVASRVGGGALVGRIAGSAVKGAAAGGLGSLPDALLNPHGGTAKQRADEVLNMALLGGVLGGGAKTLGEGANAVKGRYAAFNDLLKNAPLQSEAGTTPQDFLAATGEKALPAPMQTNIHLASDKSIPGVKKGPGKVNPYTAKFEQLVSNMKTLQAEGKVTPGREYEIAKEMWSHMAGPHDPNFEDMIKLANDKKVLNPQEKANLVNLARKNQHAGVYGIDNLAQRLPKNPNGTMRVPLQYVGKNTQPLKQISKRLSPNEVQLQQTLKQVAPTTEKAINIDSAPKVPKNESINISSQSNPGLVRADLPFIKNAQDLKDLKSTQIFSQDPYRNIRQVLGKQGEPFLNNLDKSKLNYVKMQEDYVNKLHKEIVSSKTGLGIKKNSKESALVQKYGEGQITLDELKQAAPNKWKDIVKADKWFRDEYNKLIDQVNTTRSKLYPNNPDKLVPKRKDYYRHFKELNGLEGIKNLFDTPAGIDPHLVGTSEFTKPNSKYASFMQKRGLGSFKNDAVGGFLNYIPSASYATHIDPQIKVFNDLKKGLADQTGESRNVNNFLNFLDKYSQDLAGKTNPADRFIQDLIGRKPIQVLSALNRRVKSNVILGNVGSALSQVANIPQGVAFAKQYAIKGAGKTLTSIFKDNPAMAQSTFLKERYHHKMYRQFDEKLIQQPKKFAEWMMEQADHIGTSFVWNSAYEKGLAQKVSDPVKFADNATRNLVAGRGIGEVPILQKSKLFQLVAPFQLEVSNLWKVQKDMVKAKDFGGLVTFYLAAYLMNQGFQKLRGSKIVFDPIQAMIQASQPGLSPLQRGGRVAGEVLSNMPLGQTIAANYPQYGFNLMGKKMPTRKDLFGTNDPTRFGTGLASVLSSGLQDPLFKLLPPFGGYQAEKTYKGIKAISNKGVYNGDKSKLSYPINTSVGNSAKGVLFGPSAFNESNAYYSNNRKPLSTTQTKAYQQSKNPQQYYDQLMQKREIDTINRNYKTIQKDKTLTQQEKQKKINQLYNQYQKVTNGGG